MGLNSLKIGLLKQQYFNITYSLIKQLSAISLFYRINKFPNIFKI